MRIPLLLLAGASALALPARDFERIAIVDSYDFGDYFDIESAAGTDGVIDHVLDTGADTVLWRNVSGSLPRYRSKEEGRPFWEAPIDKRRLPNARNPKGWLRWDDTSPCDCVRYAMESLSRRGVGKGIHWPYEENHWQSWTLGAWNLEHPQFWCRKQDGIPWPGRLSVAYPEVVAHKLRLLDELVALGADTVYIDLYRKGGWDPGIEYVEPVLKRWAELYPGEKPPRSWDSRDDRRWIDLVAGYQADLFRAFRRRLDRAPRKVRLFLGLNCMTASTPDANEKIAIPWKRLAAEKVFDALVCNSVTLTEKNAGAYDETRRIYEHVLANAAGLPVYFPVMQYNFYENRPGLPRYAKWTGDNEDVAARKLLQLAYDVGGAGVVLECVDYNNYKPETRAVIRRGPERK